MIIKFVEENEVKEIKAKKFIFLSDTIRVEIQTGKRVKKYPVKYIPMNRVIEVRAL